MPETALPPSKPFAPQTFPSPTPARLSISTEWLNATVVRIKITGDIDASNAHELTNQVLRRAANSRCLILDLQNVEFFSTAGFSSLCTINSRCRHAAVVWTLVPSHAVSRVLKVCDPRSTLPAVTA